MAAAAEQTWFAGRVTRQRLPVLTPPTSPDAPSRKRLLLPQGELAQLENGEGGLQYLAVLELRAGAVRGNHYHRHKCERVYIIAGRVRLVVLDRDTGERHELPLMAGDWVQLEPEIAHALVVEENGWALEAAPDPVDPADTFKHPVVPPPPPAA